MNAGSRKTAAMPYRLRRPDSAAGGAPSAGGAAVMLWPPLNLLLEGLRGRRLELLRNAGDVARVLEEVLEDLELTLPDGRAERRRLEVGQVEARLLRRGEGLRRRPR